jgi:hypothetical protein
MNSQIQQEDNRHYHDNENNYHDNKSLDNLDDLDDVYNNIYDINDINDIYSEVPPGFHYETMKPDIALTTSKKICILRRLRLPEDILCVIHEFAFIQPDIYRQKKYKLYIQENFIKPGKFMSDLIIQDLDGLVFCKWYFGSYHPDSCQITCLFCMSCGEYIGTKDNILRKLCRCEMIVL